MATVSPKHSDESGADMATFATRRDTGALANVAEEAVPLEEIDDFMLKAGDKIDLTDVAAYFQMSPDDVLDSLYYSEMDRGTELGIQVDGAPHKIAFVQGVTAADLCMAAPWVFGPEDIADIPMTRDGPLLPQAETSQLEQQISQSHAPDEFVFDAGTTLALPPIASAPPARPADITQLAEALGLTEQQVLDALDKRGVVLTGDPAADAAAASAALIDADALGL